MSAAELPDEWAELGEGEPLHGLTRVAPGFYSVRYHGRWVDVARWASLHLPGLWLWKDFGVTWRCGSRTVCLVDPHMVRDVCEAVAIARNLGCECAWSLGSAAYALCKSIAPRSYPYRGDKVLLEGVQHGYQECQPGYYPEAHKWDVSAYYWSLWTRLPSLRVHPLRGGRLVFGRMAPSERRRWEEVNAAVAGHKLLRNALVGAAQGTTVGRPYYHRGELKQWRGGPGPFRAAGLLVVRTGYELAHAEASVGGAVYANTDCVVLPHRRPPEVWPALGLVVKHEVAGEAEVCAMGVYRVGLYESGWYRRGSRFREAQPRPAAPTPLLYPRWVA